MPLPVLVFTNIADIKTYVDANIIPNGVRSITGGKMNNVLGNLLNFFYQEKTIIVELSSNTTTIIRSDMVGAIDVKIYSATRLTNNDINSTSYVDGYTFNNTTGTITFQGTRAKGEIFTIDFKTKS